MNKTSIIKRTDREKINFRVKLIELAIITLTLMAALQSINQVFNLGVSILLLFVAIVLVVLSFKFDDFTNEETITQQEVNAIDRVSIIEKNFNIWDWSYLAIYLFSILILTVTLLNDQLQFFGMICPNF